MDELSLLIDLHIGQDRQGPGSDLTTDRALTLAGPNTDSRLKVADIGCGTGAATLRLLKQLNAHVTAVDLLPDFLRKLESRAQQAGVMDRLATCCCSMESLPFPENEFDVLWSEGAIYNMGFAEGIKNWRRFLKPGGLLAVSDITWTTASRPERIQSYWESQYPEIDTASAKLRLLENSGYMPVGYFVLPRECWLEHYYYPLQASFAGFLERHHHSLHARQIVARDADEIAVYQQFGFCYSYGFYLCRKL